MDFFSDRNSNCAYRPCLPACSVHSPCPVCRCPCCTCSRLSRRTTSGCRPSCPCSGRWLRTGSDRGSHSRQRTRRTAVVRGRTYNHPTTSAPAPPTCRSNSFIVISYGSVHTLQRIRVRAVKLTKLLISAVLLSVFPCWASCVFFVALVSFSS